MRYVDRPRQHRVRIARGVPPRPGGPQNLGMDQAALENALQDFIVNLAGMEFGGPAGAAGGGAQFHFIGPGAGGPLGAGGGFHLHGNPGDYAWGRGGLDAIITQLLNHMDGAGPPPMAKESIQEIPTVNITKAQLEKSQSCPVCWKELGKAGAPQEEVAEPSAGEPEVPSSPQDSTPLSGNPGTSTSSSNVTVA